MMLILLALLGPPSPLVSPSQTWLKPPLIWVVPEQQRLLQQEDGRPAQARRRGRIELLQAALLA